MRADAASPRPVGAPGEPFAGAADHLALELERLEARVGRQVLRLRAAQVLAEDPLRGLYIPDEQVDALLSARLTQRARGTPAWADGGIGALRDRLARLDEERAARLAASTDAGVSLPLVDLARLFGLDAFEREVVLIALAPEIDRRWETLFAYVQNDVTRKRPTVGLALDLLCDGFDDRLAARSAFAPEGRLIRHRLLRLVEDAQEREPALPGRYLRLEERVAGYLLGTASLEAGLLPFTERVRAADDGDAGRLDAAEDPERAERLGRAARLVEGGGVLLLHGPAGAGKRRAATILARDLGRPLLAADLAHIAAGPGLPAILPLLRREALLSGAGLLLEGLEVLLTEEAERAGAPAELARQLAGPTFPVVLTGEAPWEPAALWRETPFLSVELPAPCLAERLRVWRHEALGAGAEPADGDLPEIAGKFALTPGQIRAAARRAVQFAAARGDGPVTADDLHAGARSQSGRGLARLAQRVELAYGWDDLVLPRRPMGQLREIHASVRHRGRVYGDWGFEEKLALGKGLNVLFAGPSGTGKTMAASILAGALRLDLYKIDLANVVSKYIGETEKNLSRIFDEAETSNAVLFFDEADALFGKRSEVKDSHDRYANIEVSYLLQRMEAYQGISILATNLRSHLDDAFARRLHHVVEFPLPDAKHREEIWRRVFPDAAPRTDDVDLAFLARQFEFAGGAIRNVVLGAAFLAAEEGADIGMRHLVLATARELGKLGKLPTRSDFGEYYELIREGGADPGRPGRGS